MSTEFSLQLATTTADFRKGFRTNMSANLCQGAVCVLWNAFHTSSNLSYCLGLCFLIAKYLKVAQRGREYNLLRSFLAMCRARHMCVTSRFPGYVRVFKACCGHLIPQFFLLSDLVSFLFAPTGLATSGSCRVKQLPLVGFDKCSWNRPAILWKSSASGEIKTSPVNGTFSGI